MHFGDYSKVFILYQIDTIMATMQLEEIQDPISAKNLNIENLVSEATWKDLLLELIKKNRLDPWEVDIVDVVDRYVSAVKEMRVLDLSVPANIMLAAAMLVRFQSDILKYEETEAQAEDDGMARPDITVEPLAFRLRLAPRRRISIMELISALEEAMQIKEAREVQKTSRPVEFPMVIKTIDIEAETERVYAQVEKIMDRSRMTTFSHLRIASNSEDVLLELFIPLLFLAHRKKVVLMQERFFEEIIIALN